LSSAKAIVEQARRPDPARATTESLIVNSYWLTLKRTCGKCDEGSLKGRPLASFPVTSAGSLFPDLLGDEGWRWRVLRTSNSYAITDSSPTCSQSSRDRATRPSRGHASRRPHPRSVSKWI
jgi:hypothetical protein